MADAEWIDNMRKIVLQAVEAGDPCDIVSGTVTKTAPLEIRWGPNTWIFLEWGKSMFLLKMG